MSVLEITTIALSLSLDCFAVSISSGGTMRYLNLKNLLQMAISFSIFQSIMPIIGYFGGLGLIRYISSIDHWVAFAVLVLVGLKMIWEGLKMGEINLTKNKKCPFKLQTLLLLSFATSIDSLAIGFTFSIILNSIILPIIIIGITTFIVTMAGIYIGYTGRSFFGRWMEISGGVLIIAIGVKTLLAHIC